MILRHSGRIELRGPASPRGFATGALAAPAKLDGEGTGQEHRTDDGSPATAFVNPAYLGGCAVTGLCVGLAEDDEGRELVVAHTYGTPARSCRPAT